VTERMRVVILAGGLGTRFAEETETRPKPMIEVGGFPILWHIMKHFRGHGLREFAVALGYKGEIVKRYFADLATLSGTMSVSLRDGEMRRHDRCSEDWLVHLVDTGPETMTGGRLKRLAPLLQDGTFMMTYGDGVSDVNIGHLIAFHRSHGRLATVTAVRPPARFGELRFDGDRVAAFEEKSQLGEGWINGGYFVLEPAVLDYIEGDGTHWELEPLERLARDGQLIGFRHEGFWQCMDTLRDKRLLESLWSGGHAPWATWLRPGCEIVHASAAGS
jgi:glucose-1-phosphate cytidylyltransferase